MFSAKDLFFTPTSSQYQVNNSLRFRASASAYLSRTFSAASSNTWTFSFWVKKTINSASASYQIFADATGATNRLMGFGGSSQTDKLLWLATGNASSSAVFRDPSAWYHIVYVSTNTSTNISVYVNGIAQTLSLTGGVNYYGGAWAATVNIGRDLGASYYFDGYLAEMIFIDGQALDPTYFAQSDATTGVWVPKAYSGSGYGTNGFYLKFADTSGATATTIGKDSSGNGNNWTPTNIVVTAGTTCDAMIDAPNIYASSTSQGVGNYCTFNPLVNSSTTTISGGGLNYTASTGYDATCTQAPNYKCYFEMTVIAASGTTPVIGMGDVTVYNPWVNNASSVNGAFGTRSTGVVFVNGVNGSTYATYTTGNVIGFAFDPATGKFWYSVNGVWANSGDPDAGTGNVGTATVGLNYVPLAYAATSNGVNANFGQRPFSYPPNSTNKNSTFSAINTSNLSTPTITNGAQHMAAVTYTGNGTASTSITASSTNSGNNPLAKTFQPDLVWIKSRSAATNNNLFDSVRTATNYLISNSTAANASNANTLTAFNSNGFTLGTDASAIGVNVNAATYVAWEWLASGSSGTISPAGTISATGRVNQTAGFSVVTFTGTGTTGQTVGHGLGAIPQFMVNKRTNAAGNYWIVYSAALGATKELNFNTTVASTTSGSWGNTTPTSNVFYVGSGTDSNGSGDTYITYCWAPISGFSSFGSYTGNGSADGVYVYTGMRPRWVLVKRTDAAGYYWWIWDTTRNTYNATDAILNPNVLDAEASGSTYAYDLLSNGFKVRTSSASFNASGGTYIYAAFAENPFKYSNAR